MDDLRRAVAKWPVSYQEVNFPLTIDHGHFYMQGENCPVVVGGLSNLGVTYILYRLGQYVDKAEAYRLLRDHQTAEFCKYVSLCAKSLKSLNFKEAKRKHYIAATILPTDTGFRRPMLYGLMTKYNPVSHEQILDKIAQEHLEGRITSWSVRPHDMRLYMRSRYINGTRMAFGLAVRNGTTGHVALGYRAYIALDNYTFTFPVATTRRHLGKIGSGVADLTTILEEVASIEIGNVLRNTKTRDITIRPTTDSMVQYVISTGQDDPLERTAIRLAGYTNDYGSKTEATKTLDSIMKTVAKMI